MGFVLLIDRSETCNLSPPVLNITGPSKLFIRIGQADNFYRLEDYLFKIRTNNKLNKKMDEKHGTILF